MHAPGPLMGGSWASKIVCKFQDFLINPVMGRMVISGRAILNWRPNFSLAEIDNYEKYRFLIVNLLFLRDYAQNRLQISGFLNKSSYGPNGHQRTSLPGFHSENPGFENFFNQKAAWGGEGP